jgi:hypothetical protein
MNTNLKDCFRPNDTYYEGVTLSPKGKQVLEDIVDAQTRSELINIFRPLPVLYRTPELFLERHSNSPILKFNRADLLGIGSSSGTDYILPIIFNPKPRETGQCGEINTWFASDLLTSGLDSRLWDRDLVISLAKGRSPLFFGINRGIHHWTELTDQQQRRGVILDASFGNIVSIDEDSGYNAEEKHNLHSPAIKELFSDLKYPLRGWEHDLVNGDSAPARHSPTSPDTWVMGISTGEKYCFSLGFARGDKPFLKVTYPKGYDQDFHWLERNKPQVGTMSSNPGGAQAINDPVVSSQIHRMLRLMSDFSFEQVPSILDPRINGVYVTTF